MHVYVFHGTQCLTSTPMTSCIPRCCRACRAPSVCPSRCHCGVSVPSGGVLYHRHCQGVSCNHLLLGVEGVDARGHPGIHTQVGGRGVPVIFSCLTPKKLL